MNACIEPLTQFNFLFQPIAYDETVPDRKSRWSDITLFKCAQA